MERVRAAAPCNALPPNIDALSSKYPNFGMYLKCEEQIVFEASVVELLGRML